MMSDLLADVPMPEPAFPVPYCMPNLGVGFGQASVTTEFVASVPEALYTGAQMREYALAALAATPQVAQAAVGEPDTVHPCGRGALMDQFDEYTDATGDGYWNEKAAAAARWIIDALTDELREHAATLPAAPQAAQPGRRLVPIEPTLEMLNAGDAARPENWHRKTPIHAGREHAARIYAAMLAASPQPSAEAQGADAEAPK